MYISSTATSGYGVLSQGNDQKIETTKSKLRKLSLINFEGWLRK
jgi:hypothetical protein